MKRILIFIFLIALSSTVTGQSKLPQCQGTNISTWNMCVGTYTYPDGRKYVGEFRNGKRNGQGTMLFVNGTRYVGGWRNDRRHGQGIDIDSLGEVKKFNWVDGSILEHTEGRLAPCQGSNAERWTHCIGSITTANGHKYSGEISEGKPNGEGTLQYLDGRKYSGEFQNGVPHGQGTETNALGAIKTGYWTSNNLTFGIDSSSSMCSGVYTKNWNNCFGTRTDSANNRYAGEFRDGQPNGVGILTYADGSKYAGAFKNSDRHGQGTQIFADESKYVGEWKNNNRDGQGTQTFANGRRQSGTWRNGIFVN